MQRACEAGGKPATFLDNKSLLAAVDSLPGGCAQWQIIQITFKGTEVDIHGQRVSETVELFGCNVVSCVEELIGNPMFKDDIKYAPAEEDKDVEESDEDDTSRSRYVIDKMYTAEFWRRLQVQFHLLPLHLQHD
jgi:hypothetical protein